MSENGKIIKSMAGKQRMSSCFDFSRRVLGTKEVKCLQLLTNVRLLSFSGKFESKEGGYEYDGEWCNGRREGHGACVFPSGDHYSGDWYTDSRHG